MCYLSIPESDDSSWNGDKKGCMLSIKGYSPKCEGARTQPCFKIEEKKGTQQEQQHKNPGSRTNSSLRSYPPTMYLKTLLSTI